MCIYIYICICIYSSPMIGPLPLVQRLFVEKTACSTTHGAYGGSRGSQSPDACRTAGGSIRNALLVSNNVKPCETF